jgi:hypothetical protein
VSGAAPTPVGGDGQLREKRRQRAATAIAPIVKELSLAIHSRNRSPGHSGSSRQEAGRAKGVRDGTCPYCPRVASLAHQAAVESGNVTAGVIEIREFPDPAAQYHVHGMPKVVMNGTVELVGAQAEAAWWTRCSERQPEGHVCAIYRASLRGMNGPVA